jgi:hypothetical protein
MVKVRCVRQLYTPVSAALNLSTGTGRWVGTSGNVPSGEPTVAQPKITHRHLGARRP